MIKSSGGGFVSPEYINSETCSLFTDRVVISKNFGSARGGNAMSFERTLPAKLSGDMVKILQLASAEKTTETPNGLCDGPATHIAAQIPGSAEPIVLYSTGGCGNPKIQRQGANSRNLMTIINEFCQKTY